MVQPPAFGAHPLPPWVRPPYPAKLWAFANPTCSACWHCLQRLQAVCASASCSPHVTWIHVESSVRTACVQLARCVHVACVQPAYGLDAGFTQLVCNSYSKHTAYEHVVHIMHHSTYQEFLQKYKGFQYFLLIGLKRTSRLVPQGERGDN